MPNQRADEGSHLGRIVSEGRLAMIPELVRQQVELERLCRDQLPDPQLRWFMRDAHTRDFLSSLRMTIDLTPVSPISFIRIAATDSEECQRRSGSSVMKSRRN